MGNEQGRAIRKLSRFRDSLLSGRLAPVSFLFIPMVVLIGINIYPIVLNLILAFCSWPILKGGLKFVGLANFLELFKDGDFRYTIFFTIFFSVAVTILELLYGAFIALLLVHVKEKYMMIFSSLLISPVLLIPVVNGLLWKLIFDPVFGIFIRIFPIRGFEGLANVNFARFAVMFADIWSQSPLLALIILAGIKSLPREPFESAIVDGASSFEVFRHITLPLLTPTILLAILIRFLVAVNTFDHIYVMTQGGPGVLTETAAIAIHRITWRTRFDLGYGATYALIITIIVTLISIQLIKRLQKDY
jgi:multiple sugar transport system permease protein